MTVSEDEPYIISVKAGNYKLDSTIEIPSYTTLSFDEDANINCKSTGEYAAFAILLLAFNEINAAEQIKQNLNKFLN